MEYINVIESSVQNLVYSKILKYKHSRNDVILISQFFSRNSTIFNKLSIFLQLVRVITLNNCHGWLCISGHSWDCVMVITMRTKFILFLIICHVFPKYFFAFLTTKSNFPLFCKGMIRAFYVTLSAIEPFFTTRSSYRHLRVWIVFTHYYFLSQSRVEYVCPFLLRDRKSTRLNS